MKHESREFSVVRSRVVADWRWRGAIGAAVAMSIGPQALGLGSAPWVPDRVLPLVAASGWGQTIIQNPWLAAVVLAIIALQAFIIALMVVRFLRHRSAMKELRGTHADVIRRMFERRRTEEELQRSEARYRAIVEDQTELICRFQADGTITFVNEAYCRYFDTTSRDLIGHSFWHLVAEEDRERLRRHLATITPQHSAAIIEHEVVRSAGESRWQQWTDRGIFDDSGQLVEFQAVGRDITDHKLAVEALRESEELHRVTLGNISDAVFITDEDGEFTYVCPNVDVIFGYKREEVRAMNRIQSLLGGELPERAKLDRISEIRNIEREIKTKLGEPRTVLVHLKQVSIKGGTVLYVCRDISDRKHLEQEHRLLEAERAVAAALRKSEARFRQLADAMPQIVWAARPDGTIDYFNRQWYEMTGMVGGRIEEQSWADVLHPDDRPKCTERWKKAAASGQSSYVSESRFRNGVTGEYRWHLTRALPVRDEAGDIVRWFGTSTDIHDQRLASEALREADRRKDEFLAILAHELRNPLAPIGMAVEIMRRIPVDNEKLRAARDVIARQGSLLTRLVDDLLDVSRITRGKIALNLETIDIARVIAQAVETSKPLIVAHGHDLRFTHAPEPLRVRGDTVRLAQVVSNLLNNAAKYTDSGGKISLSVGLDGELIVLSVRDNGVGIPSHMLASIFEPFTQVDGSRRETEGGLGIGLTLVKRLVELHGGSVEARSDGPGQGSEFIVRLPAISHALNDRGGVQDGLRQPAGDATHAPIPAAVPAPGPVAGSDRFEPPRLPRRILVVDDNVDAAESLAEILRLDDHTVEIAHDGPSALEAAEQMNPEIVFLDIGLPKLDGFQVARRLRQRESDEPLLIVATTGFGLESDRRRTAEAGIDHHLIKPIDPVALRNMVVASGHNNNDGRTKV
jgi:PAS domain S-box-containing protein